MTLKKLTLMEFAQAKKPPACKFCILPERDECDTAYTNGEATRKDILQWLHEVRGYKTSQVTGSAIDKHFSGGHQHEVRG